MPDFSIQRIRVIKRLLREATVEEVESDQAIGTFALRFTCLRRAADGSELGLTVCRTSCEPQPLAVRVFFTGQEVKKSSRDPLGFKFLLHSNHFRTRVASDRG